MNSEITLGKRIRELRLARKCSMRELASRAGLKSVAFISDIENGYRNPSPEVLSKLAAALEIRLDELRGYDPRPPLQEIRRIAEKDPQWAVAFRRILDAAGEGRLTPKSLITFVQTMAPEAQSQPHLPLGGM